MTSAQRGVIDHLARREETLESYAKCRYDEPGSEPIFKELREAYLEAIAILKDAWGR